MSEPEQTKILFEQYKLAAEMADRISARRGIANGFYFSVSSALLGASESLGLAITAIAGLFLSGAWWLQLRSYRNLNSAKWQVINRLETSLPAQPFSDEWTILKTDPLDRAALASVRFTRFLRPVARYAELSLVEQVVPLVYVALFTAALVQAAA